VARKFIVDGTEYPDPGANVTPEQFRQTMAVFKAELSNADMTTETVGEDTIYRFKKRVGTKGADCRLGYCATQKLNYGGGGSLATKGKLEKGICPICGGKLSQSTNSKG